MSALLASQETAFKAPSDWLSRAVQVVVIGAGGNGSEVVGLPSQLSSRFD